MLFDVDWHPVPVLFLQLVSPALSLLLDGSRRMSRCLVRQTKHQTRSCAQRHCSIPVYHSPRAHNASLAKQLLQNCLFPWFCGQIWRAGRSPLPHQIHKTPPAMNPLNSLPLALCQERPLPSLCLAPLAGEPYSQRPERVQTCFMCASY
jgi:hypothetical protein